MDNGSQHGLQLLRLPLGGYVVADTTVPGFESEDRFGISRQFHFASTSIEEALEFMKAAIKPVGAAGEKVA